jgi:adenosyl cobinamide kinase/adenosyl cobinamide phosphate guanylyltransferase
MQLGTIIDNESANAVSQHHDTRALYWKTEETGKAHNENSDSQYLKSNISNEDNT